MRLRFLTTDVSGVLPGSAIAFTDSPTSLSRVFSLSRVSETKHILPGAAEWAALGPNEGAAAGRGFSSSLSRREVLVTLHQDGRLYRWADSSSSAPESPEVLLTVSDVTPTCFQIAPPQRANFHGASAEDACVVVGTDNGELRLYRDLGGGYEWVEDVRTKDAHTKAITTVCWSHDGSQFLSGGEDGKIKIWSVESGAYCFPEARTLGETLHLLLFL